MKTMKACLPVLAFVTCSAVAQTPVSSPRGALPPAPTTINPGASQAAQPAAASAQQKVDSRVATPSTLSPWPQAPAGTKALATPKGDPAFGIHAIEPDKLQQGERFVIRGLGFGDAESSVELISDYPNPVWIKTTRWTSTRIDAVIPFVPPNRGGPYYAKVVVKTRAGAKYWALVRLTPRDQ